VPILGVSRNRARGFADPQVGQELHHTAASTGLALRQGSWGALCKHLQAGGLTFHQISA